MRLLLSLALFLLWPIANDAANLHVRTTGGGSASCADWTTNVCTLARARALVARGDSIYIANGEHNAACSGTPSSLRWTTAASGSTFINIYAATIASHGVETGWDNSFGVDSAPATFTDCRIAFDTSYWRWDGQLRDTETTGHGFKVISDDTALFFLMAAGVDNTSNFIIRYTELDGECRNCIASTAPGLDGFRLVKSNGSTNTDLTVEYNYVHRMSGRLVLIANWSGSNNIFQYNYMTENRSTASQHSEGLAGGGLTMTWRYNKMYDVEGTGFLVCLNVASTGCVYTIHSNVFGYTSGWTGTGVGNGLIDGINSLSCAGWQVFNNTIDFGTPLANETLRMDRSDCTGANWDVRNNLWFCPSSETCRADHTGSGLTLNNNSYYKGNAGASMTFTAGTGDITSTSDPFTAQASLNYHLSTNVANRSASALDPLADYDGVTFTTSGGAFQFVTGGTPLVQLSVSSLSFAETQIESQAANQTVTLTNAGNADLTTIVVSATGDGVLVSTSPATNCGSTLAASATCTITIAFKPKATGARTGTISITSNAASSPDSISLTGTGKGIFTFGGAKP